MVENYMKDSFENKVKELLAKNVKGYNPELASEDDTLSYLETALRNANAYQSLNTEVDDINDIVVSMSGWDFSQKFTSINIDNPIGVLKSALNMFMDELEHSAVSILHLEEIFNCVPEMIFVLDKNYLITEANQTVFTNLNKSKLES